MKINPTLSIVTITRNHLDGFRRTEQSLRAQSCRDFEWIVIDGNSTDGTKDFLPANALSEPDHGIYDAMNKGIERAAGDYILFLNAGDTLSDPDILSTVTKTIAAETPDFLYGDALETGGFYKKARNHHKIDWGMFTHHQAMIYRRAMIGALLYDTTYKIAGDYAFTRNFLNQSNIISYIPAAICIFETGGVSQQNMRAGRIEQYKARRLAGCALFKNAIVYTGQSAAALIKTMYPGLYSAIKRASSPAI